MRFEFATATRIIFGAGAAREAGALAKDFGRRALVVTGRNTERAHFLLDSLRSNGVDWVLFPTTGEPAIDTVEQGVAAAEGENCDLVVSLGGGSALDTGKAIAAMLTNSGDVLDYLEVIGGAKALTEPPAPFIAIPTTAGTGSEVTRNAVLASPPHRVKVSLRSPLMLAKIALVDPELTDGLPPALTASTGMDALTQLIEPYVSCRANALTDALCVEGIQRVARSLRIAFEDGPHPAARQDMAVASLFGGLALANAGLGAVHGLAGAIGGMTDAPHGAICAALLADVIAANISALRERAPESESMHRYQAVARLLTGNSMATADDGVDWVRQLTHDLRVPPLGGYGLRPSDAAEVMAKAARASSLKANPIVLLPAELEAILHRALEEGNRSAAAS
jgi:alcohol dehydrogenase class IV